MMWEKVKIKNITINLDNRRKPLNEQERNKISKKKLYPYIGANNIMDYVDEYLFDEEIICIAEDGGSWGEHQKCVVHFSEKCWVNNHAHVLSSNGKSDLKYLMYYLNAKDLTKFITGSTRGKLTKSALDSIQIPLPPLPIQKRIAEILDTADALRRKDEALLKKYDELAQAIFIDMFGDPVKNEKGWEENIIKNIASKEKHSIKAGPFGSSLKKEFYITTGYKIYGQEQVIADDFTIGDYYIDEERYLQLKSCTIKEGDILISLVGTYGKISVVPQDFEEGIINPRLMKITLNRNLFEPYFFKYLLQTKEMYNRISLFSRGGTMDIVNVGIISDVKIIVPPIVLQKKFVERLKLLSIQRELIPNNVSTNLFNSLLQKAFNGELIV